MSLISREAAIEACIEVSKQEEEHSKMWATGLRYAKKILAEAPSVPAVPLEPLAKWIAENLDPRCGCSYCSKDRVCCDCPFMTEQQVKEELEKWIEEQDAAEKDS